MNSCGAGLRWCGEVGSHRGGRGLPTTRHWQGLTTSLADLARGRGCYGMWVGVDTDNEAALATYRAAGGNKPEPCAVITWTF
jgi:hypothetical protein